jgi:hypothetical protein
MPLSWLGDGTVLLDLSAKKQVLWDFNDAAPKRDHNFYSYSNRDEFPGWDDLLRSPLRMSMIPPI